MNAGQQLEILGRGVMPRVRPDMRKSLLEKLQRANRRASRPASTRLGTLFVSKAIVETANESRTLHKVGKRHFRKLVLR